MALNTGLNGGRGTATSIATTGDDVDVSGSAPPTAGQHLEAIDAITAEWRTPTAGGSPLAVEDEGTPLTADAKKLNFGE